MEKEVAVPFQGAGMKVSGNAVIEGGRAYPRAGGDFGAFTRRLPPSRVSRAEVEWLQVCAARGAWAEDDREHVDYEASAAVIRAEVEAYRRECIDGEESKRATVNVKEGLWKRVYASAIKHGDVCGKWILFAKPVWVDRT